MAWQLVGAGISAIAGIIGAAGQNSQQDQARRFQQQQIDAQNRYNKAKYKYDWRETKDNYNFLKGGIQIQRDNEERLGAYQDQTRLQDYNYRLQIQRYEENQQNRLFNKSEDLYRQQRAFNDVAATMAFQSANRRLQETFAESAFDNQDLLVKMLEQEGQVLARGTTGRSAGKALQSAVASYGRNQAVIAESLISAERQNRADYRDIALQKYGADLQAEGNRMLRPERMPVMPKPLVTPRAVFQDPRRPGKPPKPEKLVNTVPGGSSIPLLTAGISGIAGMASAASSLYKNP